MKKENIALITAIFLAMVSIVILSFDTEFKENKQKEKSLPDMIIEQYTKDKENKIKEEEKEEQIDLENLPNLDTPTTNNQMMTCTSTGEDSESTSSYTHLMQFENNSCVKYEMKTIQTYYRLDQYEKAKQYLTADSSYDDARLTITTTMGDGYASTNGNEKIFHSLSVEDAKKAAGNFGFVCEVN